MRAKAGPTVGPFVVAACLALVGCGESPAPADAPPAPRPAVTSAGGLKVGDPAPDFTLPGSDGRDYTLSSYRGRQAVVLAWFTKAFTPP
jgi:cytochrome oxidase Cu insertion factor (SCO1/SenC/PrrC family)